MQRHQLINLDIGNAKSVHFKSSSALMSEPREAPAARDSRRSMQMNEFI